MVRDVTPRERLHHNRVTLSPGSNGYGRIVMRTRTRSTGRLCSPHQPRPTRLSLARTGYLAPVPTGTLEGTCPEAVNTAGRTL